MFWFKKRSLFIKSLCLSFLILFLSWGLISCKDHLETSQSLLEPLSEAIVTKKLAEVSPPPVIQELYKTLDQYQPQVDIISPENDRVFSEPSIVVKLDVKDYPLFKDPELGLGPHLHLILDNEPYRAIYSLDEPIILENLTPGTHTLRVFASRPWHESFKNDGAYDQTTFYILTKTEDNAPDMSLPLLTYSRPRGIYGAQPIMLDFYLTNAPLHLVAQENADDKVADWRIRVTINGESFLVDTWKAIYIQGFEEGTNWVQLEFLDEQGNLVNNAFNNTVRLITYKPNGQDTLSKLVRGELSAELVRSIVDPNYKAKIDPSPLVEEALTQEVKPSNKETTPSDEDPLSTPEKMTTISDYSVAVPEAPGEFSELSLGERKLSRSQDTTIEEGKIESNTKTDENKLLNSRKKITRMSSDGIFSLGRIPQWRDIVSTFFGQVNDYISQYLETLKTRLNS
ncbi:MAG: hypothetical protein ACTMUB_01425 [cyanobacterium endosymbiont of Rhopalodia musculus]|uniref:hypothetical protein n=1 Tax=cyanobacterium endosymbiont of Epithemia clementina EcSB TaxID=3034674 RepID=UPI0024811F9B|nr:hypothetical protein [cyanobacterium endosymbiont of Epithemia clementina EcSB]WGT66918.1 hypothetical protein P3F56_06630 [cyanobacterium endosymbiont of Epithemia clementina EcSB]